MKSKFNQILILALFVLASCHSEKDIDLNSGTNGGFVPIPHMNDTYQDGFRAGYDEALYIIQTYLPNEYNIIYQDYGCDPTIVEESDGTIKLVYKCDVSNITSVYNALNTIKNSTIMINNQAEHCKTNSLPYYDGLCAGFSSLMETQPFTAL